MNDASQDAAVKDVSNKLVLRFSYLPLLSWPNDPREQGTSTKRRFLLVCDAAKRGLGCSTKGWRYKDFETSFLAFVEELDLPTIIRNDDSEAKLLDDAIQALQGRQIIVKAEMERVFALHNVDPNVEFVVGKLRSLEQQVKELEEQLNQKKTEKNNLAATENAFYESTDEIKSLIASLQSQIAGGRDLYKLRSQVAAAVKLIVKELTVAPAGTAPILDEQLAIMKGSIFAGTLAEKKQLRKQLLTTMKDSKDLRYFAVKFKDGTELGVAPSRDNPLVIMSLYEVT